MKSLDKNKFDDKHSEIYLNAVLVLLCFIIFVASVYFFQMQGKRKTKVASLAANSMLDIAFYNISNRVKYIKKSLTLLAKIPVMRKYKTDSYLEAFAINEQKKVCDSLAENVNVVGYLYGEYERYVNDAQYWKEATIAYGRRLIEVYGLHTWGNPVVEVANKSDAKKYESFARRTNFANETVDKLVDWVKSKFTKVVELAKFLDSISGNKRTVIEDRKGAENLMATSMTGEDIVDSMTVRSIDGAFQASVSALSTFSNFFSDKFAEIKFNRPFLSGPVSFDEGSATPIWKVYVPIRDRMRKTIAYISSAVNIGFLSKLAKKASFNKGVSLFFTDENGTVIGHSDKQMLIKQVNLKYYNSAVELALDGKSGTKISNINGKKYIVCYRALNQFSAIDNPKWAMVLIANTENFAGQGGLLISIALIVLAVLSLYVLFYAFRNIIFSIIEESANEV